MNNTCYLSREPVSVMPGWKVGESGALMIAKERQEYLRPTTLQRTNLSFSSSERFHNSLVQVQVSRAPVIVDIRRKNHSQIEDRAANPFSDEGPDSREILVIDLDVDRSGHCPRSLRGLANAIPAGVCAVINAVETTPTVLAST